MVLADAYEVYFQRPEEPDYRSLLEEAMRSGGDVKAILEEAVRAAAVLWTFNPSNGAFEGPNLSGADLFGADLSGAYLIGAKISGAKLVSANLFGAKLYGADLSGAKLRGANLCGANLVGASLSGADLLGAKLSGADMREATVSGAKLWQADVSGADLESAVACGADLRRAKLVPGPDGRPPNLARADFRGARLSDFILAPEAAVEGAKFGPTAEGRPAFRIADEVSAVKRGGDAYRDCAAIYRQLRRCHQKNGLYIRAGEFFFREMICKRRQMAKEGGHYRTRAVWFLFEKLAGYGERPSWVAGWMLVIVFTCALLQGMFGIKQTTTGRFVAGPGLEWPSWGGVRVAWQALYFSIITFTTTGYGDLHPMPPWGQAVSAFEAASGALLLALFMVCLVRKFSR